MPNAALTGGVKHHRKCSVISRVRNARRRPPSDHRLHRLPNGHHRLLSNHLLNVRLPSTHLRSDHFPSTHPKDRGTPEPKHDKTAPSHHKPERSRGTPELSRDRTEAPRSFSPTVERCIAEIARKTAGHRRTLPASTLQTLILETSILQISRMNRATRSVIHSRAQHHDSLEVLCL